MIKNNNRSSLGIRVQKHMHPNIFFLLFKKQICTYPKSKMEDDNPRQFDQVSCRSVNVKNANFDWTRTAMPSSLLISPEGFIVEPYKLKTSCKEAPYLVLIWAFSILGTCKTYCN